MPQNGDKASYCDDFAAKLSRLMRARYQQRPSTGPLPTPQ
jgi:hypothetical protein